MASKIATITADRAGQRIDNYLISKLKGVPRSRIYRAIRSGEVRVNKKRIKPDYRLIEADQVRIPPLFMAEPANKVTRPGPRLASELEARILLEDDELLVINKPAGMPVHGGTQVSAGLIEMLRMMRPRAHFLELVHRLDRATSGCLMIAKKRSMLVKLHHLLTHKRVKKQYLALVKGHLSPGKRRVNAPLKKNTLQSGERLVVVDQEGKSAITDFRPIKTFHSTTLVEAIPITGRTHQIRVHAASIGHPIAGDEKYGDKAFNQIMRKLGLKRLFLHSAGISCELEQGQRILGICTMLDAELSACLNKQVALDQ